MLYLRLNEMLKEKGMSWQKLAEEAGVPTETMRNIYYGKVRDPKVSTMMGISRALNVSVNYLMGESLYTKEEQDLITAYRKCGNHGKNIMMLIAEYEANLAIHERNSVTKHRIPCIVPLGEVVDGAKYMTCETIEVYTNEPKAYIGVLVPNNFWSPSYCKDDTILLEKRFPKNGEDALFTIEDKVYFRRYVEKEKGFLLKCPNDRAEALAFDRMDKVYCVGTCIGIVRGE